MSRYNLIDEPWIPVRDLNGKLVDLGIKDVLLRSRELSAIEDPSPLVVASLHRFLLAVLYRALKGPTDIEHAKRLFRDGFPAKDIVDYLEHWRGRFFLFDEKYPFGQIPSFTPNTWRAWTALATEHNADNAKVLFDHISVKAPGAIPFANCVRWMLATQTFALSCGKSELAHTGTAPSASALMVLPVGRNLADTLSYALVPQNREIIANDIPIWEREPEAVASLRENVARTVSGWADEYTWRARAIKLEAAPQSDGCVARLGFASGVGVDAAGDRPDPMLGYRLDDKRGKLPRQFPERGLWRDFDSLLPDDSRLAPLVIENAVLLSRADRARFPRTVMVLGQSNNKAKVEFWRMERYALPQALIGDRQVKTEIGQLLKDAEAAGKALWAACREFSRHQLSRGKREPDRGDVRKLVGQMPTLPQFWSALEADFHKVLQEYTLERNRDEIRSQWLRSVRGALIDAWNSQKASVSSGDAWAIRALVKAEGQISRQLAELVKDIRSLEEAA